MYKKLFFVQRSRSFPQLFFFKCWQKLSTVNHNMSTNVSHVLHTKSCYDTLSSNIYNFDLDQENNTYFMNINSTYGNILWFEVYIALVAKANIVVICMFQYVYSCSIEDNYKACGWPFITIILSKAWYWHTKGLQWIQFLSIQNFWILFM